MPRAMTIRLLPTARYHWASPAKASRPMRTAPSESPTTTMLWVAATESPSTNASRFVPFVPIR